MDIFLIVDILKLAGMYILMSLGFVVIYKASHVLNLAQPGLVMLASFIGLQVLPQNFENPTSFSKLSLTLALMIVGGIILGLVVYRYFIQPLSGTSRISIVLMTLAALFLLEAVVDLIWPGDSGFMALPGITIGFQINETTYIRLFDLLPPVVGLVVWLALMLFYRLSRQGIRVQAVAENSSLAARRGININHIGAVSWAIAVVVGVIAGMTIGTQSVVSTLIVGTALKGFTVALVGGLDSIEGIVPAALLIAALEVATVRWIDQQWSEAVPFIVLLVVLMIKPWGLFGRIEELERV